jgi:ribose 5-phosphate isomerase RpiB
MRTPANQGACACSQAPYFWWCDGPCGPAKAALTIQEKESVLKALDAQSGASQIVPVIKKLAAEVKAGRAAGGVLMVHNGAAAMVYANRCPSLRAVLGTCQEAVEQGIQLVAANVLVVEYPHRTLQQMKNMLGRFVKARRELNEDVKRQLQELSSCA